MISREFATLVGVSEDTRINRVLLFLLLASSPSSTWAACPGDSTPSTLESEKCIPHNLLPDRVREAARSICSDYREMQARSSPASLKRDEFETSEVYERRQDSYEQMRQSRINELVDGLSTDFWHLEARTILLPYDPDHEQATIEVHLACHDDEFRILACEPERYLRFSAPTSPEVARLLRQHENSLRLGADVQFKIKEEYTTCTLAMSLSHLELYSVEDETIRHAGPWNSGDRRHQ